VSEPGTYSHDVLDTKNVSVAITEIKRQSAVLTQINALIAARECLDYLKKLDCALAMAQEARQAEADALQLVIALRNEEDLIDEREGMRRLKVSESTIKRMRANGSLPFVRVGVGGKLVRYRPSVIAAMT
jgi:predicted DNA-binding transcriptional regulator AlpA